MRTQYCRIKIVEGDAGEKCNVSPETISDLKKVLKFVEDHPDLSGLATEAIKPLMKIPDPQEREKAISSVSKSVKSKKNPSTGKFTKKVTESDVVKTIEKVAPSATSPKEEWFTPEPKARESNSFAPAKGSIPVTNAPPIQPLSETRKEELAASKAKTPEQITKEKAEILDHAVDTLLDLLSPRFREIIKRARANNPREFKVQADVITAALDFFSEKWKP